MEDDSMPTWQELSAMALKVCLTAAQACRKGVKYEKAQDEPDTAYIRKARNLERNCYRHAARYRAAIANR